MRIRLDDPRHTSDLREFLRARCRVEQVDERTLRARVPDTPFPEQERLEVMLYVRAWSATHPDARVSLGEAGRRRASGVGVERADRFRTLVADPR